MISGRSTVDTPTARQSRPGQGPDRPSRPDRHVGPRGQERVTIISAAAEVPREALEEFRAAGNLQHQLGELARSERPGDRLAAGHLGSASADWRGPGRARLLASEDA